MLSTRNRLAYPAGAVARFDANHPAARNNIFSGVAGPRFRSIHRPLIATVAGTEIYSIRNDIGPCNEYTTLGGWEIPGFSGAAPAEFTFAAIYYNSNYVNDVWLACMGSPPTSFGGVMYLNISAGGPLSFYSDSGSYTYATGSVIVGDPAFVLFSGSGSTDANSHFFLTKNLRTGAVLTYPVLVGGALAMMANSGITRLGGANGKIAASMISGTKLSLRAAYAWAENPWSFWYPDVV